jgi:hypothetical protein
VQVGLKCLQKVKDTDRPEHDPPHIQATVETQETLAAFIGGAHVLAGTAWLWAQEDYSEAVDVLFVGSWSSRFVAVIPKVLTPQLSNTCLRVQTRHRLTRACFWKRPGVCIRSSRSSRQRHPTKDA